MIIPEWMGAAVLGALIAALGYVSKLVIEGWTSWRRTRAARRARLLELSSILQGSLAAFLIQRKHADRLALMLRANHPDHEADRRGFERFFSQLYEQFTPEEKELHDIIRGITQYSLRPLNLATSEWLRKDDYFRTARGAQGTRGRLAGELNKLDSHLLLWHAKYEAWIPDNPRHALVYMADEEEHGVVFPRGIEKLVDEVLWGARQERSANQRSEPAAVESTRR
jgi:hypothetical protein